LGHGFAVCAGKGGSSDQARRGEGKNWQRDGGKCRALRDTAKGKGGQPGVGEPDKRFDRAQRRLRAVTASNGDEGGQQMESIGPTDGGWSKAGEDATQVRLTDSYTGGMEAGRTHRKKRRADQNR